MYSNSFFSLFFNLKWRIANNHLADLRRHKWVHFFVGMLVLVALIGVVEVRKRANPQRPRRTQALRMLMPPSTTR